MHIRAPKMLKLTNKAKAHLFVAWSPRKAAPVKSTKRRGKGSEPRVSANCLKNSHQQCAKLNCTCECHPKIPVM